MQKSVKLLRHLRNVIESKTNFPVGTLVYFGPDDVKITKIAAIIIPTPGIEPVIQIWQGKDISVNPQVVAEIGEFYQFHNVKEVVMTEGNIGCPHDEGIDYPEGENCPLCPFWAD